MFCRLSSHKLYFVRPSVCENEVGITTPRLKTNEEFEEAINNENTVRYIKYKRLSWLGHVERMTNERVAKTIYKWKPYATRPKGRPRVRWEDDVRNDLRKMGVTNWKQRALERKKWKETIEQAKTHKEL